MPPQSPPQPLGDEAAPPASKPRLDPPEGPPGLVSVVITVKNEGRHIADLLDSLLVQEPPWEVLVVDSASDDATPDIVRRYAKLHEGIRLLEFDGRRGASRNHGVAQAKGEAVAFIDGDCIANPFWLRALREQLAETHVAAGRTVQVGYWAFEALQRVELPHRGMDVTYPTCNLAYWRHAFEEAGGFDDWFHTAEDIDLNYRAVEAGVTMGEAADALVYHRARDTFQGFFKQAFWNGYGRKQLTLKHGRLWGQYKFKDMLKTQWHFWGLLRLWVASVGYLACTIRENGYHGHQGQAHLSDHPRPQ